MWHQPVVAQERPSGCVSCLGPVLSCCGLCCGQWRGISNVFRACTLWKDWLGWLWVWRTPADLVGQRCVGRCREEDAFYLLNFWLDPQPAWKKIPLRPLYRSMTCESNPAGGCYLQLPLCTADASACALQEQPGFPREMQDTPCALHHYCKPLFLHPIQNSLYILRLEVCRFQKRARRVWNQMLMVILLAGSLGSCQGARGTRPLYFPLLPAMNDSQVSSCSFPKSNVPRWDRLLSWKCLIAGVRMK